MTVTGRTRIRLLGVFDVQLSDGRQLRRPRSNDRALHLLRALALRQGQFAPIAVLIEEVWGGCGASPLLRKTVQRLRELDPASPQLVRNTRGGYALNLEQAWLDVHVLTLAHSQLLAHTLHGDEDSARRCAEQMLRDCLPPGRAADRASAGISSLELAIYQRALGQLHRALKIVPAGDQQQRAQQTVRALQAEVAATVSA